MAADPCPNADVRAQQNAQYLQQCRAYEKVSPDDKSGAGIQALFGSASTYDESYITADGSGVYFEANNAFGGSLAGPKGFYVGERAALGWVTSPTAPAYTDRAPTTADIPTIQDVSADLSRAVYVTSYPFDPLDQGLGRTRSTQTVDVYRREVDGSMTWLSPSVTLPDTSTESVFFGGASVDGSRVLLESNRRLVSEVPDESVMRIYLSVEGKPMQLVTRDTGPNGGAPMNVSVPQGSNQTAGIGTANIMRLSPDGSRVVFRGGGAANKLYLREHADDPARAFTVDLGMGTGGRACPSVEATTKEMEAFRASGKTIRFQCRTQLTDDPLPPSGVGTYERDLDSGGIQLVAPEVASVPEFFETEDALVPGDRNGVMDVYQRIDGWPYLISSGTDPEPARLVGTNADGRSVFFTTANSLVPQDTDRGVIDLYVARVGGGFLIPEAVPECVTACQGPGLPVPDLSAAASVGFVGAGNVVEATSAAEDGRVSVTGPKKAVKGTAVRLSVRVPGKGRVRVSGSGLHRISKRVSKAGEVRVMVRLSAWSRATQRRKGRVAIRATVRFVPASGRSQSVRVKLTFTRKAKAKKGKRGSSRSALVRTVTTGKDGR